MITAITTEKQYNEVAEVIETYLKKGSQGMTDNDKQELRHLSVFAEAYELKMYPMPMQPQSLLGMIQIKYCP